MRVLNVLSLLLYMLVLAGLFTVNLGDSVKDPIVVAPPYHYVPGDLISEFNGFVFTFIFSLLFFGLGAPLALVIEGLKQASIFSVNKTVAIHFLFTLPNILAAFAAVSIGAAAYEDIEGKKPLEDNIREGARTLLVAIALFCIIAGAQVLLKNFRL